ncbi:MAG: dockerin type I repeat-containing protein, partial [Muribaculaceae bacterium]|nr:dockerin type I repeat-containing protein [Muribaculaceae bacterium]
MDFTFGKRMKTSEMYAFGSCNALVRITSSAVTPPYLKGKSIFPDKVYNNAIVYAPRQSVDAYREALVWKYFNIEGVNFMPEWCDVNGDGEVNISDVTAIIDIQLKGGVDIAGDVNGDEEVNISDINAVIDLIVSGE